jgi:hypothetical protein
MAFYAKRQYIIIVRFFDFNRKMLSIRIRDNVVFCEVLGGSAAAALIISILQEVMFASPTEAVRLEEEAYRVFSTFNEFSESLFDIPIKLLSMAAKHFYAIRRQNSTVVVYFAIRRRHD